MNTIKKTLLLSLIAVFGLITIPNLASAQTSEMSKEEKKEIKSAEKLVKAKIDLGKKLEKLQKEEAKLVKTQTKFEKDNAAGKLSPNDVEKITKQKKSIEGLKKDIEKLEKYIRENEDGI